MDLDQPPRDPSPKPSAGPVGRTVAAEQRDARIGRRIAVLLPLAARRRTRCRQHAEVIDNWRVSGLRGSGSCDYTLNDVFVPTEHTHDMLDPPATQPGTVYRWPAGLAFSTTVAVVPLGIARAALDTFTGSLAARTRRGTAAALRDRELIQSDVGRAEVLHAAARALLLAAMNELTDAIDSGGDRLIRARAMYRAACTNAAEAAIRIAGDSPLQMMECPHGRLSGFR